MDKFILGGPGHFVMPKSAPSIQSVLPRPTSAKFHSRPSSARSHVRPSSARGGNSMLCPELNTAASSTAHLEHSLHQARLQLRMDAERVQTEALGEELRTHYEKTLEQHKKLEEARQLARDAEWRDQVERLATDLAIAQTSIRTHELTAERASKEASRALDELEAQKATWLQDLSTIRDALDSAKAEKAATDEELLECRAEMEITAQRAQAEALVEYEKRTQETKREYEERQLFAAQSLTERFHQEIFAAEARAQAETKRRIDAENAKNEFKNTLAHLRAQLSLEESVTWPTDVTSINSRTDLDNRTPGAIDAVTFATSQPTDAGSEHLTSRVDVDVHVDDESGAVGDFASEEQRFDSWGAGDVVQDCGRNKEAAPAPLTRSSIACDQFLKVDGDDLHLLEARVRSAIQQKDEVIDWLKDQLAKTEEELRLTSLVLRVE